MKKTALLVLVVIFVLFALLGCPGQYEYQTFRNVRGSRVASRTTYMLSQGWKLANQTEVGDRRQEAVKKIFETIERVLGKDDKFYDLVFRRRKSVFR